MARLTEAQQQRIRALYAGDGALARPDKYMQRLLNSATIQDYEPNDPFMKEIILGLLNRLSATSEDHHSMAVLLALKYLQPQPGLMHPNPLSMNASNFLWQTINHMLAVDHTAESLRAAFSLTERMMMHEDKPDKGYIFYDAWISMDNVINQSLNDKTPAGLKLSLELCNRKSAYSDGKYKKRVDNRNLHSMYKIIAKNAIDHGDMTSLGMAVEALEKCDEVYKQHNKPDDDHESIKRHYAHDLGSMMDQIAGKLLKIKTGGSVALYARTCDMRWNNIVINKENPEKFCQEVADAAKFLSECGGHQGYVHETSGLTRKLYKYAKISDLQDNRQLYSGHIYNNDAQERRETKKELAFAEKMEPLVLKTYFHVIKEMRRRGDALAATELLKDIYRSGLHHDPGKTYTQYELMLNSVLPDHSATSCMKAIQYLQRSEIAEMADELVPMLHLKNKVALICDKARITDIRNRVALDITLDILKHIDANRYKAKKPRSRAGEKLDRFLDSAQVKMGRHIKMKTQHYVSETQYVDDTPLTRIHNLVSNFRGYARGITAAPPSVLGKKNLFMAYDKDIKVKDLPASMTHEHYFVAQVERLESIAQDPLPGKVNKEAFTLAYMMACEAPDHVKRSFPGGYLSLQGRMEIVLRKTGLDYFMQQYKEGAQQAIASGRSVRSIHHELKP